MNARPSSTSRSSQSRQSATTVRVSLSLSLYRFHSPILVTVRVFKVLSVFFFSFLVFGLAEMVDSMKKVAKLDVELTVEERNLLSVGYKNVIGARRASWRILSSIEQKEEAKGNEHHVKRIKEYRSKVESELSSICHDIMTVIDEHLIPSSSAGESTVFYYKM